MEWREHTGEYPTGLGREPVRYGRYWLAKRDGDGKLMSSPAGMGDPVTDGSASALVSYLTGAPDQSGCVSNPAVSTFQTSYNATYFPAGGAAGGLTVDGIYGTATDTALKSLNVGANQISGLKVCTTPPATPATPATTSTTTVVAPPAAATSSTGTTVAIIAGIGVAGWLAWKYMGKHRR